MPLIIDDPETLRLASDLADRTGLSPQEAVRRALEQVQRREAEEPGRYFPTAVPPEGIAAALALIRERVARLPLRDARSPDEILGYDERGLPG